MKLITDNYKTHMARQFFESVTEASNTLYYAFAATTLPFDDDNNPPVIPNSTSEYHYVAYDEMLFGKRVGVNDVRHMVRNVQWQADQVYAAYDHETADLDSQNFFVVSEEGGDYYVFKCLDNNQGANTSDQPLFSETTADDEFYQTNDGYQWKYMYTIDASEYTKFATADYVPVIIDANVTANAINGSIETVSVTNAGINYNSFANGQIKEASVGGNNLFFGLLSSSVTLSSNTDFYKGSAIYIRSGTGAGQARTVSEYIVTGDERRVVVNQAFTTLPDTTSVFEIAPLISISGDGTGAQAICTVNAVANSIANVEIVSAGSGYSFANVSIIGNTGVLGSLTADTATARAIISPPGGHGSDVVSELFANKVGISVSLDNTESGVIPAANDYRKVGLIKDPLFANVEITLTTSDASLFNDGETVIHYEPFSSNTLLKTFTYTLSRYQTLTMTSTTGFSAGDNISLDGKSGDVNSVSGSDLLIRLDSGSSAFVNTEFIGNGTITKSLSGVSVANPAVVTTTTAHTFADATPIIFANITGTDIDDTTPVTYYVKTIDANTTAFELYTDSGLTSSFNNTTAYTSGGVVSNGTVISDVTTAVYTHTGLNDPISGKDDLNQSFGMDPSTGSDLPLRLDVSLNDTLLPSTHTTTSFTITGQTLDPATDVVVAQVFSTTESILENSLVGATTGEVSNRVGSILRLRNIRGNFTTGSQVKGLTSGTTATIESIDRSFEVFNQLTRLAVEITATGSESGISGTGFDYDETVTQDDTSASGVVYSISDTITRSVTSITAQNPPVVTTSVNHGFSNGDILTFKNLNGTVIDDTGLTSYYVANTTVNTFTVYTDSGLSLPLDNSANTTASSGQVIGTASFAGSAKTFSLTGVRNIFAVSDDATSTINNFINSNGAVAKITEKTDPDIVDGSGRVLFLESIEPITRTDDQNERFKMVFQF